MTQVSFPKVITVYSQTPECGKKTITLNTFMVYSQLRPNIRILIIDFSRTEKMRFSLLKYGKSHFSSMDFLSEIPEDTLVNEALSIHEDKEAGSFLRVLPSAGCPIPDSKTELLNQVKYRVNSLFFKDIIDLLVFIVPVGLERSGITMATILQSDLVWIISTEKYPTVNLTKSTIQNFLTFLTVPTLLIMNKVQPPLVFSKLDQMKSEMEKKFRHPIFYTIPWLTELNEFADQGIFILENPQSKIEEIFQELSNYFQIISETGRFETLDENQEGSPIALFITDKSSGESMYYYFFGKAEDEMKNPALITAALNSIALMVSETAGRPGDLRSIDNGNTKIILRKGKKILGILYSPVENDILASLLTQFVKHFEKEYEEAINDFSKTGRLGGFTGASRIVEDIFEQYIFELETVSRELNQKIIAYATEKDQLRNDPEEVFRNYVKIHITDQSIIDLLMYEFTTTHNSRHEFLLELNINPRKLQRKIENETGNQICQCTEPPKYVQIQRFDALGILDLPENLRPTARALFTSDILSPETAAKITKRNEEIELQSLEELRKLGYVRRVLPVNL